MHFLTRLGLLTVASITTFSATIRAQTPLHVFHGDSAGDEFGVSVALIGDANRDGYADILVGAHWDDNFGTNSGSARLFSGLDGAVLSTVFGGAANDFFGLAVADLGDVDGDGYDDFAVGADGSDIGGSEAGLVRVFSGKTSAVLRSITGTFAGEQLGAALAGVQDGSQLILIGAPASNRALVVSALSGATLWNFQGLAAGDAFGAAVATGRDLNGDGVADYAIGAPNDDVGGVDTGSVTIFSGATGVQIRVLHGLAADDRFGSSVAMIPDADGDGLAEIVVGAPRHNGPGSDAGAIYLYSGFSGSPIFSRPGEASGDEFGTSVSCMATLTGNPEPAFVVGARFNDFGGSNAGAAYVYSGLTGAQLRVLRGHAPGDWFGGAVAGGADVNGDGIGDLVVSARLADVNGSDSGSVEVHSSPIAPSTWYVDAAVAGPGSGTQGNPYRSIQYAINRTTTRSGDTVSVQPGTYYENLDLVGKSIQLVGNGAQDTSIIDGQFAETCLVAANGESLPTRIENLKFYGGDSTQFFVGGMYLVDVRASVLNCTFEANLGEESSALLVNGGTVRVSDCRFSHNGDIWYPSNGGAVGAYSSDLVISNSQFLFNQTEGGGGAIRMNGQILITGCHFEGNTSYYDDGGGILVAGGSLDLRTSTFAGNSSGYNGAGGGVCVHGSASIVDCVFDGNITGVDEYRGGGVDATFAGPVIVQRTLFRNNIAADGGGAAGGQYFDCQFEGNRATAEFYLEGNGGGIWNASATRCIFTGNRAEGQVNMSGTGYGGAAFGGSLTNCSLVGNDALLGGGGAKDSVLLNTIAFGNTPTECDGTTAATFCDISGGWPGLGNISSDPLFVNATFNDLHLTNPSPCIDAGDPSSPLDPDGSRADMGAFPYDPNYCPAPFVYCTPKTNSCGQLPAISFTGSPHAGATSGFTISTTGARSGKRGLLLYSPNGTASSPFQGGTLCIAPQGLKRSPQVAATGGTGGAACDAVFSIDWAAFSTGNLGGNPPPFLNTLGQRVNVQWWGRDNIVVGSLLSAAIQYEVCP